MADPSPDARNWPEWTPDALACAFGHVAVIRDESPCSECGRETALIANDGRHTCWTCLIGCIICGDNPGTIQPLAEKRDWLMCEDCWRHEHGEQATSPRYVAELEDVIETALVALRCRRLDVAERELSWIMKKIRERKQERSGR